MSTVRGSGVLPKGQHSWNISVTKEARVDPKVVLESSLLESCFANKKSLKQTNTLQDYSSSSLIGNKPRRALYRVHRQDGTQQFGKQQIGNSHIGSTTFWQHDIMATRHFGSTTFWHLLFFWHHNILATRHFGTSAIWHQDILPLRHCGTTNNRKNIRDV